MNKFLRLFLVLSIALVATSACKSKQKITEIPAGAKAQATTTQKSPEVKKPVETTTTTTPKTETLGEEVTRKENFSLADGETNGEALKLKYHVVVGSFGKQENAKNLQTKLNGEGYKAIVVVNEAGMFRVLMSSFNDYNEAHAFIKKITDRFKDAWVLVKK